MWRDGCSSRLARKRALARQCKRISVAVLAASLAIGLAGCPSNQSSGKVTLSGHLLYADTNGPRPIAFDKFEIWRQDPGAGWAKEATGSTDGNGQFRLTSSYRHNTHYAIRVFPDNRGAFCCTGSLNVWVEPGAPQGKKIQLVSTKAGQDLIWNYTFDDPYWPRAFNAVETLRRAYEIVAAARKAANDVNNNESTQSLIPAHVSLTGCPFAAADMACTWPVSGDIFVPVSRAMDDYVLLHEYGHWVQYSIGSMAWIASDHSGCKPGPAFIMGGGPLPVQWREQHAWLEGSADWLGATIAKKYPAMSPPFDGDWDNFAGIDESSTCGTAEDGSRYERHVANMLWDLTDGGPGSEASDHVFEDASLFIQIIDNELGTPNTSIWPTTDNFYYANFYRRGSWPISDVELSDIYKINNISVPPILN